MKIAIIKYNAGNVQSVLFALKRLGYAAIVTDDERQLAAADRIIFPGVGHAGSAMDDLKSKGLDQVIKKLTQPVLGICVGMQLLCTHSEEGNTECLGIINAAVRRFMPVGIDSKVPQTGWNTIYEYKSILLEGIRENAFVYYVHSYYVEQCAATTATTAYTLPYSAIIQKDNFYGLQFHTEKSAAVGDTVLSNFLQLAV